MHLQIYQIDVTLISDSLCCVPATLHILYACWIRQSTAPERKRCHSIGYGLRVCMRGNFSSKRFQKHKLHWATPLSMWRCAKKIFCHTISILKYCCDETISQGADTYELYFEFKFHFINYRDLNIAIFSKRCPTKLSRWTPCRSIKIGDVLHLHSFYDSVQWSTGEWLRFCAIVLMSPNRG